MPSPHISQPRGPIRSSTRISWSFVSLAVALLSAGLVFYVSVRSVPPMALQRLHISSLPFPRHIAPNVFTGSFPSLVHVAAFALLTCALVRATMPSVLAVSAFWAAIDILWEVGCNHPAIHTAYRLVGVAAAPACTYDAWDVAASLAGAAIAVGLAGLILRLHATPAPAEE